MYAIIVPSNNSTFNKRSFTVCEGKKFGMIAQYHALCLTCRFFADNAKENFPKGAYEITSHDGNCPYGYTIDGGVKYRVYKPNN